MLQRNQVTIMGASAMALDLSWEIDAESAIVTHVRASRFDRNIVRAMDVIVASAALLFLLPLMLLIGIVIVISDPGPVFFRQLRIGVGGNRFHCYKFRTMVTDAEVRLGELLRTDPAAEREWKQDHKLKNDPRISGIGRFLRKSSMDELPQLLNVLNGDMSLVGPRPIVEAEIGKYGRYFADYCRVKPGITGLWQISGRNNVTYRRRVALDVRYARSRCFRLDCRILLVTVPSVLLARGSY